MQTVSIKRFVAGLMLCVFAAFGVGGPLRAQDDEALRKRALALNRITGEEPIKGEIKSLVADPATTKKLLAVAAKMAQDKKQPFNYNGAYILATAARGLRDLEHGRVLYRIAIKEATRLDSGQKMADAYTGFIALLLLHRKHEEVTKLCQEFLDQPSADERSKFYVLYQMILSLGRQGKTEEATKMIDTILKKQPRSWIWLEVKAQVEREAGRYEEALKLYEEVLERLEKDKDVPEKEKEEYQKQFRYALSNLYIDLKQVNKAAEQLKKLLEKDPDNPTYNNDLGYIWADHDMNLDEAEKLIRKAIEEDRKERKKLNLPPEEDRDNAAYLDSLGWVLYKKKNYKEAKEWLLKATREREGEHVEILDHLGDAHMALGEKEQAIAAWEKALKVPALSKRDELRRAEVKKKLEMHKK